MTPADIDVIFGHGISTVVGDTSEARMIQVLLGTDWEILKAFA